MNDRQRNYLYAAIALGGLIATLLIAYALRDTTAGKFPHQVDKVRPGGVLPQNR